MWPAMVPAPAAANRATLSCGMMNVEPHLSQIPGAAHVMDYLVVVLTALLGAALALFSGFGLGTLLLPLFSLFFPVEIAVAATAVVHLLAHFYRALLTGRYADLRVVLAFSVPAALLAVAGAAVLDAIAAVPPLASYGAGARSFQVTLVKVVVAVLIAGFAVFELVPALHRFCLGRRYLPLGGALAGFFGGLSGHQGALRSAFLTKMGLDAPTFVGTTAISAVIIDITRLVVYGLLLVPRDFATVLGYRGAELVVAATLASLVGTTVASRFLSLVHMGGIRLLVGAMLVAVAAGLGAGLL